jgi:hypothetical protein
MKIYRFLLIATLCASALIAIMTGCKYDVAEPLWNNPPSTTIAATITSIDPAQAPAGVNYITIHGTNFSGVLDSTKIQSYFVDTTHSHDTTIAYSGVYFNNILAEVVECSSTMLKVRRPNVASSSCVIKVIPSNVLFAAKMSPYNIDAVVTSYGNFIDNVQFATVAMDNAENLYTVATSTRVITQVTPTGQKTIFTGLATKAPTDARVNPAGDKMYLLSTARKIDVVDLQTGSVALLPLPTSGNQLPSGKLPSFGDFDTSGYFYCGGVRTGIIVIPPSLVVPTATLYTTDNITAMRVYKGYLYVLVKPATGTPSLVINRHLIGTNGALGAQEQWLVLDQTIAGTSTTTIRSMAFSANGTLYLCTNLTNPIFIVDPVTKNIDYLYKGIIPAYGGQCCSFSKQVSSSVVTSLYVITGDGTTAQQYKVYQVNLGS